MSHPSNPPTLGKLELRIMQVLWQSGPSPVRPITDALNRAPGRPVAHSTVQTLLRKLEVKGAVAHESDDRIFTFRALYVEGEVTRTATRDLLSRVFEGSAFALAAHLLRHENVSADERLRLRALIDASEEETNDR